MEITNQVNLDNSQTKVTAFIKSISSNEQLEVADKINRWINREMPEVKAITVGIPLMFGKLMQKGIPGMLQGLVVSLFFITIVLIITFKSVKIGLYSMIPNVWPIIVVFGCVGLAGYVVNMSVAIVGMITLGLCVDDSVHFLVKFIRARNEGYSDHDAITYTFHHVGSPLIFTSIILVLGFGVLMFSDFALNYDLGMLCSLVIALALIADFVLLPATILKFSNHKRV